MQNRRSRRRVGRSNLNMRSVRTIPKPVVYANVTKVASELRTSVNTTENVCTLIADNSHDGVPLHIRLDPMSADLFSYLPKIAANYKSYDCQYIEFEYVPNSQTNQEGFVNVAWTPSTNTSFPGYDNMAEWGLFQSTPPYQTMKFRLGPRNFNEGGKNLLVPDGSEQYLTVPAKYELGSLEIRARRADLSSHGAIGRLQVTYSFLLKDRMTTTSDTDANVVIKSPYTMTRVSPGTIGAEVTNTGDTSSSISAICRGPCIITHYKSDYDLDYSNLPDGSRMLGSGSLIEWYYAPYLTRNTPIKMQHSITGTNVVVIHKIASLFPELEALLGDYDDEDSLKSVSVATTSSAAAAVCPTCNK